MQPMIKLKAHFVLPYFSKEQLLYQLSQITVTFRQLSVHQPVHREGNAFSPVRLLTRYERYFLLGILVIMRVQGVHQAMSRLDNK